MMTLQSEILAAVLARGQCADSPRAVELEKRAYPKLGPLPAVPPHLSTGGRVRSSGKAHDRRRRRRAGSHG